MSKVLENLSEEEAYLWAILSDPTGVDLSEFSFVDEEQKDSCFRLWPYQWKWFQCTDALQIDQSGRSVGKSLSIKIRMFSFPFLHPGQEAVITGPELVHVKPLIRQIQNQFLSTRLGRYMLPSGRNHGIVSWPFELKCRNGATIYGRIPQKDGKAIKGTHPLHLEMDESQDYPEPGWTELIETLKRGHAGASWRAHGVTRGVRDHFYKFTQPDSGWTVHRITAMHRPTWSDQERREKVDMYGSKDHPDYRRNILGLHGDSQSPLFALFRLMACVDNDEMSDYNTDVYRHYRINGETLSETNMPITSFLDFPQTHKKEYDKFWAGMDVGYCVDTETEILTQRGWLTWDQVEVGDQSLGINPVTHESEWQEISDLYNESFDSIPLVHMKGQSFDALTTPHHKWLVRGETGNWRWRQTRELTTKDCIPLAVSRSDLPREPIYSNSFVELVAWFWTEGWWHSKTSAGIGQSHKVHPEYVERIRLLLKSLCGESGVAYCPGTRDIAHQWVATENKNGQTDFRFRGQLVAALRQVVDLDKVPSVDFLCALTAEQLDLFIETSIDADGWRTGSGALKIEQRKEKAIKAFEIACALAGYATSTSYDSGRDRYHLSIMSSRFVQPVKAAMFPRVSDQAMQINHVDYSGVIWCPTVTHGNWLARRNGSVYFTGNTNHPSEILVFGEKKHKEKGSILTLLSRIHLERVAIDDQADAIIHVTQWYGTKAFSMDKTGNGLPLFQSVQARVPKIAPLIKGYNFAGKILAEFDTTVEIDEHRDDPIEKAGIEKFVLEVASDELRGLVDAGRMWLPWDRELIGEFQGQTFVVVKDHVNIYGRKIFNRGSFHTLDAAKMAVLGWRQEHMEALVAMHSKHQETITPIFIGF